MCRKKLEGSWDMEEKKQEKIFKKKVEFPNMNLTFLNEDERRILDTKMWMSWDNFSFS